MLEADLEEYAESASPALTVEQAIANLTHSDISLRYYAAWWLGKCLPDLDQSAAERSRAVAALIHALEDEADRTELGGYPLRRNAARALGKLGDQTAVAALITCLNCSDFYVREAAAQSLGTLGDPASIPALTQILAGGVAAAQLVPGRPHLAQPVEAAMEALAALNAEEAIGLAQPFLDHPLGRVRHAAARSLYQLTQDSIYGEKLIQAIADSDLKMRRAVLLGLGASGYLPGAEAIATAAVENSFKLIALHSLVEHHLERGVPAINMNSVLALMDNLL